MKVTFRSALQHQKWLHRGGNGADQEGKRVVRRQLNIFLQKKNLPNSPSRPFHAVCNYLKNHLFNCMIDSTPFFPAILCILFSIIFLYFFLFFSSAYQSSENQISFTKINSFTEILVFVCLFISINSAKWSIYNTIKSSGPIIVGLLCCRAFLLDFVNCKYP